MDSVPEFYKWSDVDSYLHKKIRELQERVEALEQGKTRVLVNDGVACTEDGHIFLVGSSACMCGEFGGAA